MRAMAAASAAGMLSSVVMIWMLRGRHPLDVYVSGLGAPDSPVAGAFNTTLLAIGVCGVLLAVAVGAVRAPADRVGAWLAAAIAAAGASFVVASRVTCTAGCPLPGSPSFALADAVHVTFAVIGFAAGCAAMLAAAIRATGRAARRVSAACAAAVGVIALGGAFAALFRVGLSVGPSLEFVATTVALGWCGWFGLHLARREALPAARPVQVAAQLGRRAGDHARQPSAVDRRLGGPGDGDRGGGPAGVVAHRDPHRAQAEGHLAVL